uniref:Uncharacterized protein n=1 Tax=Fagus sylvatica TaxID=28930 RepID=A0A2N9HF37_FAGSY
MPETFRHGKCFPGKPWNNGDRAEQPINMNTLSAVGFMYGSRHDSTSKPLPLPPSTMVSHVDRTSFMQNRRSRKPGWPQPYWSANG